MARKPATALTTFVLVALCGSICRDVGGQPPIVLAGVTGGICVAQFEKCKARCSGSGVCTARCLANDRSCRAGGKPLYR
jgi:hypothetical protein